ncbi:MAG: Ig domain-containing protein [Candidatus Margulisbacteria bacterium]|jgi:hypothetical protein|nr:Ig domain-containing protein [Candidatus Margulisiibacteriota bacterium]
MTKRLLLSLIVLLTGLSALAAPPPNLPVIAPLASQEVNFGETVSFTVSATVPSGKQLYYEAANLPEGAALNPLTGLFVWKPTIYQLGTYRVTFAAWDRLSPQNMASKSVRIAVVFRKTFSERGWGLKAGPAATVIETDNVEDLYPNIRKLEVEGVERPLTQESFAVGPAPQLKTEFFSHYNIDQKTVAVVLNGVKQKNIVLSDIQSYGDAGNITSLVVKWQAPELKPGRHLLLLKAANELGVYSQTYELIVNQKKAP